MTARAASPFLTILLGVLVGLSALGMDMFLPSVPAIARAFNVEPGSAQLAVTTYLLGLAAGQLAWGPLSDRIGRKPVLVMSQIGTFIGFIILARASSLWMIYLARVIDGATAGNLSLAQAYIADNTAPEDRAKKFGLIGIAFGLGFFVGPSITGFLSARYGLTAPIYLAAVMSATNWLADRVLFS